MAVHNEEEFIEEAIKSVLNQTMKDWELIIINDRSNDRTKKIAEKYTKKDKRITLINLKKNKGWKSGALNQGLKKINGDYVCFLDGDDIYLKNKLKNQVNYMKKHKNIDMIYGLMRIFGKGRISKTNILLEPKGINLKKLLQKRAGENIDKLKVGQFFGLKGSIANCSVMIKRKVFKKCKFDENLKRTQDYDMWFQIIGRGYKITPMNIITYNYRIHPKQSIRNKKAMEESRDYILKKLRKKEYFK